MILRFMLLLVATATGLGIYGYSANLEKLSSLWWTRTEGRITHCEIRKVVSLLKLREQPRYTVDVVYRYPTPVWFSCEGTRISFSEPLSDQSTAERLAEKYAVGKTVPVLYDPSDPRVSVLDAGDVLGGDSVSTDTILFLWFPLALSLPVAILLTAYVVMRRNQRDGDLIH